MNPDAASPQSHEPFPPKKNPRAGGRPASAAVPERYPADPGRSGDARTPPPVPPGPHPSIPAAWERGGGDGVSKAC